MAQGKYYEYIYLQGGGAQEVAAVTHLLAVWKPSRPGIEIPARTGGASRLQSSLQTS
jgi:hypothetical protein